MYPHIIQGSSITVVIDNKSHTLNTSHPFFGRVRDALKKQDWKAVKDFIEPKEAIIRYFNGRVKIENGVVYYDGIAFHNALSNRMMQMLREGFSIDPLVKFLNNLMLNPSSRSVNELYPFLEKSNLPITSDGCFLAYKRVRIDYKDCHSGKIDNSVGQVVLMERNKVDDDRERTCSYGLHFCSLDYLKSFGGARTVIVKINPADVVSIPSDYNDTKGRCARYEVVGEIPNSDDEHRKAFTKPVQDYAHNDLHVKDPQSHWPFETKKKPEDWLDWDLNSI